MVRFIGTDCFCISGSDIYVFILLYGYYYIYCDSCGAGKNYDYSYCCIRGATLGLLLVPDKLDPCPAWVAKWFWRTELRESMFIWRIELDARFFLNFLAWLKSEAVVGLF